LDRGKSAAKEGVVAKKADRALAVPVKRDIWKVSATPVPLNSSRLQSEQKLEEMIVSDSLESVIWVFNDLLGCQQCRMSGVTPDAAELASPLLCIPLGIQPLRLIYSIISG
jgi:hypothetical protein